MLEHLMSLVAAAAIYVLIRKLLIAKGRHKLVATARSTCDKLSVELVPGKFNHMCYDNSADFCWFAARSQNPTVIECIAIRDNMPYLHYLASLEIEGETRYYETTLGYQGAFFEYYKVGKVNEYALRDMEAEFDNALRYYLDKYVGGVLRRIFVIERIC